MVLQAELSRKKTGTTRITIPGARLEEAKGEEVESVAGMVREVEKDVEAEVKAAGVSKLLSPMSA